MSSLCVGIVHWCPWMASVICNSSVKLGLSITYFVVSAPMNLPFFIGNLFIFGLRGHAIVNIIPALCDFDLLCPCDLFWYIHIVHNRNVRMKSWFWHQLLRITFIFDRCHSDLFTPTSLKKLTSCAIREIRNWFRDYQYWSVSNICQV